MKLKKCFFFLPSSISRTSCTSFFESLPLSTLIAVRPHSLALLGFVKETKVALTKQEHPGPHFLKPGSIAQFPESFHFISMKFRVSILKNISLDIINKTGCMRCVQR